MIETNVTGVRNKTLRKGFILKVNKRKTSDKPIMYANIMLRIRYFKR